MATAVQGEELPSPAPPIGPRVGRSRPSSSLPLIFSNICYICMMSLLLCVKSRDGGGDPEPREDAPSPAQDPPALPRFDAGDSASYVLPRLEGVKVGHIQEVELVPNKIHFMKTLSLKPLAFEIPDFLSEDECKLLIHLAKHEGLQKSPTAFSKDRADYLEKLTVKQVEIFDYLDLNQDGQLQMIEMLAHERLSNNLWLTPADVQEMYVALKADPDGNGVLSFHEFKEVNMQDFYKYMDRKKGNQSELVRNSQQVWLDQRKQAHPIMHAIRQRVVHLTRLPAEMIEYSENLQVVQYAQGGYYHAHWDSEDGFSEDGCGHTKSSENIYMVGDTAACRYVTVLIYLNNVIGGGETTFPIADNRTYDLASLIQGNIDLRDTCRHCDKGNLRVKPVQGTAIFWYNHLSKEGWMGDIDEYSLHGGCLVTEGNKWIASQWINVDHSKNEQFQFQKRMAQRAIQSANYGDQSEWTEDKSYSDVHGEL